MLVLLLLAASELGVRNFLLIVESLFIVTDMFQSVYCVINLRLLVARFFNDVGLNVNVWEMCFAILITGLILPNLRCEHIVAATFTQKQTICLVHK